MSLQEKLDAQRGEFESSAPKEAVEIMHKATEDLRKSGIVDRAVKVGDNAPDFTLNDAYGKPVQFKDRLTQSPVVLGFYRGRW
ncbi:MAG: hypothetical protein WCA08_00225 [Desulfoferrobacter sp.]